MIKASHRHSLLASSSLVALLIGGVPTALAACDIAPTTNQTSITNSSSINCFYINGITVTGNVTNQSGGVINATGFNSASGITVTNGSIGGAIVNNGSITSTSGQGINVGYNGTVSGGISNSGLISAGSHAITVNDLTIFSGGITNTGTLSAGGSGIAVAGVSTFLGGITNSGTITAYSTYGIADHIDNGIAVANVSSFGGGITNSGLISAADNGIVVNNVPTFTGNISNSGTITGATGVSIIGSTIAGAILDTGTLKATTHGILIDSASKITSSNTAVNVAGPTFAGGISNAGTLSAGPDGIVVGSNYFGGLALTASLTISSFSGGISNSGTISAGHDGIVVGGNIGGSGVNRSVTVSSFSGGISNSGQISAGPVGILVGGFPQAGSTAVMSVTISTFAGGITNSGTISASGANIASRLGGGDGIVVGGNPSAENNGNATVTISTFAGGITNSGTISVVRDGILVGGLPQAGTPGTFVTISTFSGGISNPGAISAGHVGIFVGGATSGFTTAVAVSTFSGGITNSGAIDAKTGILVSSHVSSFLGAIANSGTISASGGTAIDVSSANNAITIDQTGGLISGAIKLSAYADQLNVSGGTINGNIVGQGTNNTVDFTLGAGATFTYSNTLGGVNTININSGTVMLDGTIASGGVGAPTTLTIAAAGTLLIGSNAASVAPNVTDNGTFGFAQSGAFSFGNVISGTGAVEQVGPGSTTLTGINSYSGGTTVSAGTLQLSGSGTLGAPTGTLTVSGGTLDLNGTAQTTGALTLTSGTIEDSAGGGTLTSASFGAQAGTISAALAGSGALTKTGSGTVVLSGNDSYTGATTIDGGTLEVDGMLTNTSRVTVNSGGMLSGTGTVDPPTITIASGGTLSPGSASNPTGTLTLVGNLVFQSGSTYAITISPTQASKTIVNGTATLGGANVVTDLTASQLGSYKSATYTILSATNLLGSFNPAVTIEGGGLTSAEKLNVEGASSLSYSGNGVDYSLVVPTYAVLLALPSGSTYNAQNAAGAINSFILAGSTLPSGFQNLANLSGPVLNAAVNQLAGQAGGSFVPSGFMAGDMFLNMVLNPFVEGRDGAQQGFGPALAYAPEDALAQRANAAFSALMPHGPAAPQLSFWGGSYGGSGTIDGNAATGAATVTSQVYGFAAGVDDHVAPDTILGFALGGGGTNWGLDQGMGGGHSGMVQTSVYGSEQFGPAYVSGALAYSWHDVSTTRDVTLAGLDTLNANFGANVVSSRLEAGYRLPDDLLPFRGLPFGALPRGFGVTPYAALEAQAMVLPAFSEWAAPGSSAQFALNYNGQNYNTARTELGAWLTYDLPLADQALKLYTRLAYAHDFNNEGLTTAFFQQLPGGSFLINTAKPAANDALVTAGLEYRLADGWSMLGKFDGEFASTTTIYSGTGVLQKVW